MNFILFQLEFIKFQSKRKFIKFELHNYGTRTKTRPRRDVSTFRDRDLEIETKSLNNINCMTAWLIDYSQIAMLRKESSWGVYTIQQTSSSIKTYGSKRPANFQQTSSKRPAIHVYFEYICWKFAGRLLDRVNTLLV